MNNNTTKSHMQPITLWDRCWKGLTVYRNKGRPFPCYDIVSIQDCFVVLKCLDSNREWEIGTYHVVHRNTMWWIENALPSPTRIKEECKKVQQTWDTLEERKRRHQRPLGLEDFRKPYR